MKQAQSNLTRSFRCLKLTLPMNQVTDSMSLLLKADRQTDRQRKKEKKKERKKQEAKKLSRQT